MEIPGAMDYGDSIIDGVESENVEEINDAYRAFSIGRRSFADRGDISSTFFGSWKVSID